MESNLFVYSLAAATLILVCFAWESLIVTDSDAALGQSQMPDLAETGRAFLKDYNETYRALRYKAKEAEWTAETHIVEGDDTNARNRRATAEALAAFTGSEKNIFMARECLEARDLFSPTEIKQFESILYKAADNPQTVADLVKQRIAAEAAASEKLYGFRFTLDGNELSTNAIDEILWTETDLEKRRAAWECSKTVGPGLRPILENLVHLRNETVRALGYDDFFSYEASDYAATADEMIARNEQVVAELRPLYRELHTWARHELAARYGRPVPDLIPAHYLPNRWGQEWGPMVTVEGFDLDAALADKTPEWLVRQAERFYVSLGFEPLPDSFHEKSSLFPLPSGTAYKKNNHASAWHLDLDHDVRSLMSVESNSYWYETVHHELGHVYYYLTYSNADVPPVLRLGSDRSYHEAIGTLMGLAAMQPRFAAAIGLVTGESKHDPVQALLKEALNAVCFIPWSSGVMTRFEYELYSKELPPDQWNARWWELKKRYQGIVPPFAHGAPFAQGAPGVRGEEFCDAATKTHILDDAAQYYDYALSYVLLYQLHEHIARTILEEDIHDCNYYNRKDAGAFLRALLRPGATRDGKALLRETIGDHLSARAMLDYYQPLMDWLKEQNRGRTHTLPEL